MSGDRPGAPLGLKWRNIGNTQPTDGRELENSKLSEAIKGQRGEGSLTMEAGKTEAKIVKTQLYSGFCMVNTVGK